MNQTKSPSQNIEGHYSKTVRETLWFAYRKVLWPLVLFVTVGFIGRLMLLSNANLFGIWVDHFSRAPLNCRPLPQWVLGWTNHEFVLALIAINIFGFILTFLFRIFFARLSARAISSIYDEVTYRTSRFPIQFFDTNPVGAIVTRFSSDYGNVFRIFGGPFAEFCVIIFDLIAIVILMLLASVWLTVVFIAMFGLYYVVFNLNKNKLRQERRELSKSRAPSIAHFSETVQGAATVRVFSRQSSFVNRFEKLNNLFIDCRRSTNKVTLSFSFQMTIASATLLFVTGIFGFYLQKRGLISVGSIGVAFTFLALSNTAINMFFEWMSQFEEAMTGVERLDHYLRSPLESALALPSVAEFPTNHPRLQDDTCGLLTTPPQAVELKIQNLWLRYQQNAPWILQNLDLNVRAGERLGIVGRTGSGKSSLVQALMHLYPYERGEITLNGLRARRDASKPLQQGEIDMLQFRSWMGLITQEPVLFLGTLRENLQLNIGKEVKPVDDSLLLEALGRVGLLEWVNAHPFGLSLPIEERGRNLSLGERQLICMARCVVQRAPLIIMDEATSAIDPQSEEIIVKATEEVFKGKTQLIIAHRLSTLENCDFVLWLDQGKIKRIGPSADVLREMRQCSE